MTVKYIENNRPDEKPHPFECSGCGHTLFLWYLPSGFDGGSGGSPRYCPKCRDPIIRYIFVRNSATSSQGRFFPTAEPDEPVRGELFFNRHRYANYDPCGVCFMAQCRECNYAIYAGRTMGEARDHASGLCCCSCQAPY